MQQSSRVVIIVIVFTIDKLIAISSFPHSPPLDLNRRYTLWCLNSQFFLLVYVGHLAMPQEKHIVFNHISSFLGIFFPSTIAKLWCLFSFNYLGLTFKRLTFFLISEESSKYKIGVCYNNNNNNNNNNINNNNNK